MIASCPQLHSDFDADNALAVSFRSPSAAFGPVPFWWWVGDPLTQERLAWQLDQLVAKGIRNAIISYNHHADASPNTGTPSVFSPEWWDLLSWILGECKTRGMQISFQDYALLTPLLQEIGRSTAGMEGGRLVRTHAVATPGGQCTLAFPAGSMPWKAFAWPSQGQAARPERICEITDLIQDGEIQWQATEESWELCAVGIERNGFDPLHPDSGALVIDRFYAPFETHCHGELGSTLAISFQDELDFGSTMPFWSNCLADEFQKRKGYSLIPIIPALWHDLGSVTPKVRIDYHDVVVQLLEERYFIPIFHWHEARGLLFGNDNCGRGAIRRGMEMYADPFRTMRWYSAPGTDDPNLDGERAFKGLKVNSSIAHLYRRPRVWNECFHSSGWGATPASVIAALNADFVYGATVVNLHGLYYSTHGSWWEWAPPDFHFRQPYWEHTGAFAGYVTRLCQMLSQGTHVCDVAIVYPITSIEAGFRPLPSSAPKEETPYSEMQGGSLAPSLDESEGHAFGVGRELIRSGIDFDLIDFQSLERAEIRDGRLHVSGESYSVLLLPAMAAVRFSTLEIAHAFFREGGMVIAYGRLPEASERAGADDPELNALLQATFQPDANAGTGKSCVIQSDYTAVVQTIQSMIVRDFIPRQAPLQVLHRTTETHDIYFVFNPSSLEARTPAFFRARGRVERWDAWTGNRIPLTSQASAEGTEVSLVLGPKEACLIVFDRASGAPQLPSLPTAAEPEAAESILLDGPWQFELKPTMDNRFGDFRLPADGSFIGAEARRFRYHEGSIPGEEWSAPEWDDSGWPLATTSYGPRFWKLGPVPECEREALQTCLRTVTQVDPATPVSVGGRDYFWSPYEFSQRWGIENDPFLKHWSSGPHGLKGCVPDEFIDLHCEESGAGWFLWSSVQCDQDHALSFVMGSRSRYTAWLGGRRILQQDKALPPGFQSIWNLPHYQSEMRQVDVALESGTTPLLLEFVQPEGQRVRAYAAFIDERDFNQPCSDVPALRWFRSPGHPVFSLHPSRAVHPAWFRFLGAPGLVSMHLVTRGKALRVWAGGKEQDVALLREIPDGTSEFAVALSAPQVEPTAIATSLELPSDSFGGDAFPEPVTMQCATGVIETGDWSLCGLATYSGAAWYRKSVMISPAQFDAISNGHCSLDLGNVAVSAEVFWNGVSAGTLIAPPWSVDVTALIRSGENHLEILVANTLANHYSVGIPSPYAMANQTVSGLLGPVTLNFRQASTAVL